MRTTEEVPRDDERLMAATAPGFDRRRRRWLPVAGVGLVVAMLSALLAFGLTRDPTAVRSPLIGRAAPDFSLPTLHGDRTVALSELRGHVVVINFWASWCGPCREEHPDLAAAWQRYRDQGVVVLGISFQDAPAAARAYVRELGGGWPLVVDRGSRTALAYGVYGVPETFFIGRDGRVASKTVGPVSYETLTTEISRLLGGDTG